jgi:hypothetical protein
MLAIHKKRLVKCSGWAAMMYPAMMYDFVLFVLKVHFHMSFRHIPVANLLLCGMFKTTQISAKLSTSQYKSRKNSFASCAGDGAFFLDSLPCVFMFSSCFACVSAVRCTAVLA